MAKSCVTTENPRVEVANVVLRRAAARTGTNYVDVTTLVCVRGRCPVVVDHTATYADTDHVSVTWAKLCPVSGCPAAARRHDASVRINTHGDGHFGTRLRATLRHAFSALRS